MNLSEQQKAQHLAGLLEEKRQVEQRLRGNPDDVDYAYRLKLIDEQLALYGQKAKAPAKRAERRPAEKKETR